MKIKPPSSKQAVKETKPSLKKASTEPPGRQSGKEVLYLRDKEIQDLLRRQIDEKIQHSKNTRKLRNRMIYTLIPLGFLAPIFVSIGVYLQWLGIMSMAPLPQAIFISLSFIIAISLCGFGFVSLKGESASNDEMNTLNYLNSIRGYQPPGAD